MADESVPEDEAAKKAAKADYDRRYYRAHADKKRAASRMRASLRPKRLKPELTPEDVAAKKATQKARQKAYDAEKYRLKKAEINARRMEWAKANTQKQRAADKRSYDKNVDKRRAAKRLEYKADPDRVYARHAAYREKNPERIRVNGRVRAARYKARKKGAVGTHTTSDILAIAKRQKHRCAYCRTGIRRAFHIDHIAAVSKGGGNDRRNIQLLCGLCNRKKAAKDAIDFAQETGRLI